MIDYAKYLETYWEVSFYLQDMMQLRYDLRNKWVVSSHLVWGFFNGATPLIKYNKFADYQRQGVKDPFANDHWKDAKDLCDFENRNWAICCQTPTEFEYNLKLSSNMELKPAKLEWDIVCPFCLDRVLRRPVEGLEWVQVLTLVCCLISRSKMAQQLLRSQLSQETHELE